MPLSLKALNTLAHVIETARREWGIFLFENPSRLVKRPKTNPGRNRRLLTGEFEKLIEACQTSRAP
ncbi:MAG: hypothetical protein JWN13_1797, partial [Betaproteobacteria bacterium]|nr:hypothetical protein [Betaproteobacteria bacterium]